MNYSYAEIRARAMQLMAAENEMAKRTPSGRIEDIEECHRDTSDMLNQTLLRLMHAEQELAEMKASIQDKTPWRMEDGISATYLDGCVSRFTVTRGAGESADRIVVFVAGDSTAEAYALLNSIACGAPVLHPVVGINAVRAAVQQQLASMDEGERQAVRRHFDALSDEIEGLYSRAEQEAAKVQAENAEGYETDFATRVLQHLEGWSAEDWCEFLARMPVPAGILRGQLIAPPGGELSDAVIDAVAEALGSGSYDCMRVWSAWGVGTMGPDDFAPIAEDGDRIAEIARAAIASYLKTGA